MSNKCKSYLKTSRESAGLTQEDVSEILGVGVRSISDYENGKTFLPPDLLNKMSDLYGDKYLAYNYFKEQFGVSKEYPRIKKVELTKGVLNLQSCIDELSEANRKIVKIAKDGIVDETEKEDWESIGDLLLSVAGVAMSLKLGEYEKSPMAVTTGL